MARVVELEELMDLSRRLPEVKIMIRVVCQEEGATSAAHLRDINRDAFMELHEAAVSLHEQLGEE